MLPQPDQLRVLVTVRDGQLTAVTCSACGCRLQTDTTKVGAWRHFGALGGRDALGHRTPCVDAAHDGSGRAAVTA